MNNCNIPIVPALNTFLMNNGSNIATNTTGTPIASMPILPPMNPLAVPPCPPSDDDSKMNCLLSPASLLMLNSMQTPTPMLATTPLSNLGINGVNMPSLEALQLLIASCHKTLLNNQTQGQHPTATTSTNTTANVGEAEPALATISEEHDEEHLRQTLQMRNAEIQDLRLENERLMYELRQRDNMCQRHMQKLDAVRCKNREHNKRYTALQKENKTLRQRRHMQKLDAVRCKNREHNKRYTALQKENKTLRQRIKKLTSEESLRTSLQKSEVSSPSLEHKQRVKAECDTLHELYLNSGAIKRFLDMVKKYGEHYEKLKKRHCNLTACVGKEDDETLKIRMKDVYEDIVVAEKSYHALFESLDIMKTESQGKELELMTKNGEKITVLEQEIRSKSCHLEEYVKQNQSLHQSLTDREMKLRQSQNKVSFLKEKLSQTQSENTQLKQQFNWNSNENYEVYGMNGNNSFFNNYN
eukprot:CAMPEP_0202726278 /NCGR_PEP_ID=MMETSP1385-20130828/184530_1 /ASSEMBLY_ACC=CAM_ASM_000861 /TAXON_ID=933848 /ORGANISM="Elphidium margaritaceum" /LENGTH=469 /DNA_ID=CAMNT_0049392495 /DNA_START=551 /DNA_END=1960 /DNA_ORIENTATION=-